MSDSITELDESLPAGRIQQKSRVIVFPAENRSGVPPISNSRQRFIQTVRKANPDADPNALLDLIYEFIFEVPSRGLRKQLGIDRKANLRKTLYERNPVMYQYLCMAEAAVAEHIEQHILIAGQMKLDELVKLVRYFRELFRVQANNIMVIFLKLDVITGQSLVVEDIPF